MSSFDVAFVVPLQGPAGIFGPSAELCAELAADEINRDGGILGRELRLVPVDGGADDRSGTDAVLMLLVGTDAVRFNRAFGRSGLAARCLRLSTLMDENMLLASGASATHDLFSTAGFFASMVTPGESGLPRAVRRPVRSRGAAAGQPR